MMVTLLSLLTLTLYYGCFLQSSYDGSNGSLPLIYSSDDDHHEADEDEQRKDNHEKKMG